MRSISILATTIVALTCALTAGAAAAQTPFIDTIAGTGLAGFSGDGDPATNAQLNGPTSVATRPDGTILIADRFNDRIRGIDATGTIATIAGTGSSGYSGDSGPAINAQLNRPSGVAPGPDNSVLIADLGNQRIRRIDSAGTITTIAGTGTQGYSGDNGPATNAQLSGPAGVAAGPGNSVLIADYVNNRIRRIDAAGTITTIAGTGSTGYSGDNGPAINAKLSLPLGVAAGPNNSVLIADTYNHRIRRIDAAGTITTIAGTGTPGSSGDNGPAINAQVESPFGVAAGPNSSVLIADTSNQRVRRIDAAGTITNFAGTGTSGYAGDSGPATNAQLSSPATVATGPGGIVLVADANNHRIRRIAPPGPTTCVMTDVRRANGDGFDQADVTVQAPGGLLEITDVTITNGSITLPDFITSTTQPLIVTATKAQQGQTTRFSFNATNTDGTIKHCT